MNYVECLEKEVLPDPESCRLRERVMENMLDALRFYQNSMTGTDVERDPVYGIQNAYGMINSFFFEGTDSEKARVREGKVLLPELLDYVPSLLKILRRIVYLFAISRMTGKCTERTVYRTERKTGLDMLVKSGMTQSLTSTSKVCEFPQYLFEKEGISILKLHIPENIPYIDVNELLGEKNAHPEEQEILLPPFLEIKTQREEELFQGNIPVYSVEVTGMKAPIEDNSISLTYERDLLVRICDPEHLKKAKTVLTSFNRGYKPEKELLAAYLEWKKLFQEIAGIYFQKVWRAWKGDKDCLSEDFGHPGFDGLENITFKEFRDPFAVNLYGIHAGDQIWLEAMTADGDRPVWMPVDITVTTITRKGGCISTVEGKALLTGCTGKACLTFKDRGTLGTVLIVPIWDAGDGSDCPGLRRDGG